MIRRHVQVVSDAKIAQARYSALYDVLEDGLIVQGGPVQLTGEALTPTHERSVSAQGRKPSSDGGEVADTP